MLIAKKDNKVYSIPEQEAKTYKARGFDIFNEDGTLKEHGAGKAVSLEEYEKLKAENKKLKEENKTLKAENKKLKEAEKSGESNTENPEK